MCHQAEHELVTARLGGRSPKRRKIEMRVLDPSGRRVTSSLNQKIVNARGNRTERICLCRDSRSEDLHRRACCLSNRIDGREGSKRTYSSATQPSTSVSNRILLARSKACGLWILKASLSEKLHV